MNSVIVVRHPLISHSMTCLRNKETLAKNFRPHSDIVSKILLIEATKDIPLQEKTIETPLTQTTGHEIAVSVVLVPVLRAGLSMLFAAQQLYPSASVGIIGLERDEETAVAREYYRKFPSGLLDKLVIVLDPMLATGGSMLDTLKALKEKNAENIRLVSIVSAPEGIKAIHAEYPDIPVYTAAIDHHLNENKYIVPGLGDYGDRYFDTW